MHLLDLIALARVVFSLASETDASDAHLLLRYMKAEKHRLYPFKPIPKAVKRLNRLLKARTKLAKSKATIGLSLKGVTELVQTRGAIIRRIEQAIALIDKRVQECIKLAGYSDDYQRCL